MRLAGSKGGLCLDGRLYDMWCGVRYLEPIAESKYRLVSVCTFTVRGDRDLLSESPLVECHQFTPEGGVVCLLRGTGDLVRVTDTGCGIGDMSACVSGVFIAPTR